MQVVLIGYGGVGRILAEDLHTQGVAQVLPCSEVLQQLEQ